MIKNTFRNVCLHLEDAEHIAKFSLANFCLHSGDVEHIASFGQATICKLSRDKRRSKSGPRNPKQE